jgi:hypothetical protein
VELGTLYKWAVVLLAVVAVLHLVRGHKGKGKGCKGGAQAGAGNNSAWYANNPVQGPSATQWGSFVVLGG